MPKVILICTYCANQWEKTLWSTSQVEQEKCEICGDKNIKILGEKDPDKYYREEGDKKS